MQRISNSKKEEALRAKWIGAVREQDAYRPVGLEGTGRYLALGRKATAAFNAFQSQRAESNNSRPDCAPGQGRKDLTGLRNWMPYRLSRPSMSQTFATTADRNPIIVRPLESGLPRPLCVARAQVRDI